MCLWRELCHCNVISRFVTGFQWKFLRSTKFRSTFFEFLWKFTEILKQNPSNGFEKMPKFMQNRPVPSECIHEIHGSAVKKCSSSWCEMSIGCCYWCVNCGVFTGKTQLHRNFVAYHQQCSRKFNFFHNFSNFFFPFFVQFSIHFWVPNRISDKHNWKRKQWSECYLFIPT